MYDGAQAAIKFKSKGNLLLPQASVEGLVPIGLGGWVGVQRPDGASRTLRFQFAFIYFFPTSGFPLHLALAAQCSGSHRQLDVLLAVPS